MKSDPRICPYLDMPIQHISDRLLRRMYRKTSKKDILQTIEHLRKALPEVVIRTSLMVGFPGETKEEFAEVLRFVEEGYFDHIDVFTYSREKSSSSYSFEGQLSEEIKQERYKRLMQAQLANLRKKNQRFAGKTLFVLLEGYHPESSYLLRGRYPEQAPEVDGVVILNDFEVVESLHTVYKVQITSISDYDLIGTATCKSPLSGSPDSTGSGKR